MYEITGVRRYRARMEWRKDLKTAGTATSLSEDEDQRGFRCYSYVYMALKGRHGITLHLSLALHQQEGEKGTYLHGCRSAST